jgi:signal transduction histidine kinase/ligand-binding sensor domain-containing protein
MRPPEMLQRERAHRVPPVRAAAFAAAVCLAAFVAEVRAAPASRGLEDYAVTFWNENNGLFASRIMVLEQDRDGYLWVGTDVGLLRFDGVHFEPMSALTDGMPQGEITALLSARDGTLWIGIAAGMGVARLRNGALERVPDEEGPRGLVSSIAEDGSGEIWVGTSLGLWRYRGTRFEPVALPEGMTPRVVAVYEDRVGRLWVATSDAVLRRDRNGDAFQPVGGRVTSRAWQRFSEAPDGTVWMADFERGFRLAESSDGTNVQPRGWGASLLHDRRGNFWVATRGQGLWRARGSYRPEDIDIITIRDGLVSDAVQCLFEDREGNVWVGTQGALHRLTPHKVKPLSDLPLVRAVAAGPDGSVWVGGTTGLTRVARAGRDQYGAMHGMPGAAVLAIYPEPDGTLWVSTERGLARFANGRFSSNLLEPGPAAARVLSIARHDDSLWLRDVDFRLVRLSIRGELLPTADVPDAFMRATTALEPASRGRLLIGTITGQLGIRRPGGAFESFDTGVGAIGAIYEDAAGAVWVGGEAGLARLHRGQLNVVSVREGMQPVQAIVDDGQDTLWVGLASGIARIEKTEFARATAGEAPIRYRLFSSADGAAGRPIARGSRTAVRTSDGRLWFATSGGVTIVDPLAIGAPRPEVPARIESVTADALRIRQWSNLDLPPHTSHVQVAFTALTLTDAARVQFRYRLVGIDTDWVEAGTVRQASYTNLRPGTYAFQVRASNGDGLWGPPDTIELSIAPAFYQTRTFYACVVLALLAGTAGGWQLHVRRVRRQFALVLAERIRMSRAIHDTLLQGLAGFALQLDDVSHGLEGASPLRDRIRAMRERVEDSIRDARQSIWELRNPRPAKQRLSDSLRDAAVRTIAQRPVTAAVTVHGTEHPSSDAVEEQLLLICREAVSNAVAHGRASHIRIDLTYRHDQLQLRIEDNGCGFDERALAGTAPEHGHYGMMSMRERAATAGGQARVVSSPGAGTIVHVAVPPA